MNPPAPKECEWAWDGDNWQPVDVDCQGHGACIPPDPADGKYINQPAFTICQASDDGA